MENVIDSHVYYSINMNGKMVPFITDAVINMWIVMVVIIAAAYFMTRKLNKVPTGAQNLAEMMVDFINNFAKDQIGHHYKAFAPYLATVLLFLAVSNMLGLFNVIPSGGALSYVFQNPNLEHLELSLHPPTKNFNVTLCMALLSIVIVTVAEFRYKGFKGWLRGFYYPSPIFGFVKILDYVVRPLSLCLRLFGNILGGFIVMTLVYSVAPFFAPAIVSVYFDLFDGILQGYVFVFLTSLYIAEAVEEEEPV